MTFFQWLFRNPNQYEGRLDAFMHGSTWGLMIVAIVLGILAMMT